MQDPCMGDVGVLFFSVVNVIKFVLSARTSYTGHDPYR